jgi:hypothetical protein
MMGGVLPTSASMEGLGCARQASRERRPWDTGLQHGPLRRSTGSDGHLLQLSRSRRSSELTGLLCACSDTCTQKGSDTAQLRLIGS